MSAYLRNAFYPIGFCLKGCEQKAEESGYAYPLPLVPTLQIVVTSFPKTFT